MYQIVLCDDCQDELDTVKEFVKNFFTERGLAHNVVEYTSPAVLLRDLKNGVFFDLFFLDIFLITKRAKRRFVIPGTEGHPGYGFKAWMKSYALPEHLLQWPLILCPLMAAVQAGLGVLIDMLRQAG